MKIKYLLAASAVSLSAAVFMPAPVAAQQITSGVEGRVESTDGTPLAGATVVVTDTRTGAARTLTTGSDGGFRADTLVTGGPYTVTATAAGFEGQTVEGVYTSVSGNTGFTFQLSPATTADQNVIVVTGARAGVVQIAVGPGTGFNERVLQTAPTFDRDIRDIIRLDPRVALDVDTSTGQSRVSCLGGNDRSNAFTVDAISQGDLYGLNGNGFASRSSTPIPYAAIRETSVEFAPFDVEYGQFTGCAINVITRSGGNNFHGSAFFEYSNNDLRGKRVADIETAPIEPEKKYGVSLGGPIIRDRLFFFAAYEHQQAATAFDFGPAGSNSPNTSPGVTVAEFNRFRDILSREYGIETGDLATNLPYKNDRYFGRLDWQINDKHRLEGTYQHLDETSTKRGGIFESYTSPTITGINNFYTSGTKSDYWSVRLYSDWSDKFSTEIRYAHSDIKDIQDPVGGGDALSDNPTPRIVVGTMHPDPLDPKSTIYGNLQAGPDQFRAANDLHTKVDYATFIGRINAGQHTFKVGATYNKVNIFNLFVPDATGTLVFTNLNDLENGILANGSKFTTFGRDLSTGNAVGATQNVSGTGDVTDAGASFNRYTYSVFAQDDWSINDRLSAVLGVRLDWYDGDRPNYNPAFAARYNGRSNAVAFSALPVSIMPRAAFTYDAGDIGPLSRTKLRLGAGLFSGGDPLVWFSNAFQNNGFGYSQGSLRSAACSSLAKPVDVVVNGQFTGVPACVAAQGQADAARGLGDVQSIDPNIKTPQVLRANFGIESGLDFASSGLFSGWQFKGDFIYSHFMNPFIVTDLSQVVDPSQGLNGYTSDGRPIYRAISATAPGCTAVFQGNNPGPIFTNVNAACFATGVDDEIMLTNSNGFDSWTASAILSKSVNHGVFTSGGNIDFLVGYAYTVAHDRNTMTSSQATSNYDYNPTSDRQFPEASNAIYGNTHTITARLSLAEEFFNNMKTRFSTSFSARSGRHYSLTFRGGSVFGDSVSGVDNALLYIPTGANDPNVSPMSTAGAAQAVADFASSVGCAKDYMGRTIERNSCSNDWYFDVDLSLSQDIPGPGRLFGLHDTIKLYATVDNFLNLLDKDWNTLRQRDYTGRQPIASLSGIDSQGRYIFSGPGSVDAIRTAYQGDNQLYTPASVWRIKVGISYDF
ncbi:MAG: TonB-dependent receptor [Tsuneonella sp.]